MKIKDIMERHGISCFGIASYLDMPPLLECRAKLRIPQKAKSVIVCLFPYNVGEFEGRNISRYAMLMDYHLIAGGILEKIKQDLILDFPNEQFEWFTDNSPIREVNAAWLAGLGVIGKNGLLINERFGSYVFIGEIVTTMELTPSQPNQKECLGCMACLQACPNGALSSHGVNLEVCRSHITQKKGELTPFEIEEIKKGGLVWGCDICNDVCPMNKGVERSNIKEFYSAVVPHVAESDVEKGIKTRAYGYRGKKTILRNINILYNK